MVSERDAFFMRKALQLAERGRGGTSPNPMVGALVVDPSGVIVGRGAHEFAGGPHAEVHALQHAGSLARGATLYCTLEPCAHQGRTGPCAPLVVDAGIARAVIAIEDPNPRVAGRGNQILRDAGIDVTCGVLADEAARVNVAFFTVMRQHRPHVTLKVATSMDAKIAAGAGARTALTGPAAARLIHRDRAEVDAVAVGSTTVLVDDPMLTPRIAYRRRPLIRVVFDRRLRVPPTAALFRTLQAGPVIIMTSVDALEARATAARAIEAAGGTIVALPRGESLRNALQQLLERGVTSLVVEGGTVLHQAFWDAGLVDRVQMYVAPVELGPNAVDWLPGPIICHPAVIERTAYPVGDDVLIEAYVHRLD